MGWTGACVLNIVLLPEGYLPWEAGGMYLVVFENRLPPYPLLFLVFVKLVCLCLTRLRVCGLFLAFTDVFDLNSVFICNSVPKSNGRWGCVLKLWHLVWNDMKISSCIWKGTASHAGESRFLKLVCKRVSYRWVWPRHQLCGPSLHGFHQFPAHLENTNPELKNTNIALELLVTIICQLVQNPSDWSMLRVGSASQNWLLSCWLLPLTSLSLGEISKSAQSFCLRWLLHE